MTDIQGWGFVWAMMLMFWAGIWTAYDSPKGVNATALKVLGTLLAITGILMIGIWIGRR